MKELRAVVRQDGPRRRGYAKKVPIDHNLWEQARSSVESDLRLAPIVDTDENDLEELSNRSPSN
jgi:hypothetical protein